MSSSVTESVVDAESSGSDATAAQIPRSDSVETDSEAGVQQEQTPEAESGEESVLQDVQNRTRRRRRRRSAPPGWTLWVARQAGRSRSFFSHKFPVWLMERREELVSYINKD